jgi:hypothetical protein
MSRLQWRVQKIENHCGESRAVTVIVNRIRQASDEELYKMIHDGWLQRMGERLSEQQLHRLIERCKEMLIALRPQG